MDLSGTNLETNRLISQAFVNKLNFAGPNLHIVYRVEADYRFVHSYDKCKLLEALQFSRTAR